MRQSVSRAFTRVSDHIKHSTSSSRIKRVSVENHSRAESTWARADLILGALLQLPRLLDGDAVRPLKSSEERRLAQRLIYREYLARGYCAPNPLEQHFHIHSILPSCRTLGMFRGGECRGTVSCMGDSPIGFPMEKLYAKEVDALRKQGCRMAEIGLLALDCRFYARGSYSLTSFRKSRDLFSLFRAIYTQSRAVDGLTDLLMVVHPKHENLYRYIGFRAIGPIRTYPGAEGNLALPMRIDLEELEQKEARLKIARYLLSDRGNAEVFRSHHGVTGSDLLVMLSEHPTLWPTLTIQQRLELESAYPRLGEWTSLLDSLHGSQENSDLTASNFSHIELPRAGA